jgi:hypothetical protein
LPCKSRTYIRTSEMIWPWRWRWTTWIYFFTDHWWSTNHAFTKLCIKKMFRTQPRFGPKILQRRKRNVKYFHSDFFFKYYLYEIWCFHGNMVSWVIIPCSLVRGYPILCLFLEANGGDRFHQVASNRLHGVISQKTGTKGKAVSVLN